MSMLVRQVASLLGLRSLLVIATMSFSIGCGAPAQNVESVKSARTATDASETSDDEDARPKVARKGKTKEDAVELCMSDDGEDERTDYAYIAEYQCPDGSMPLEGKVRLGAAARVGNVGAGPDGHIVDLYEVPCTTGRVRVFIDGYHCKSSELNDIDPKHLTRKQLMAMAAGVRARHDDPSSREAMKYRKFFFTWLMATPQLTLIICDVKDLLPSKADYVAEFAVSLGASVIEDGHDPVANPIRTHMAAFAGVAKYYQAVLAEEGPSARDATLDKLVEMLKNGELEKRLPKMLKGCKTNEMGVRP